MNSTPEVSSPLDPSQDASSGTGSVQEADAHIVDSASLMRALHESRETLLLLLENSPDAVFVEDLDGTVLYANSAACELHKMTREALLGADVLDLVPPEHRDEVANAYGGWRTGELREYTGYSYTASGSSVPVEIRASSVVFQGQPALILTVRDISERIRAEAERETLRNQLQDAQKMESLGVMAGGIAHDFNNLLTGILGNTELALKEVDGDSVLGESLRGIDTSASQAAEHCRQLLAYVGQGKSRIERVNVNRVVEGIVSLFTPTKTNGAEIRLDLSPDLQEVAADHEQVQQVIQNLVYNACEACLQEGDLVTIHTGVRECDEVALKNARQSDALPCGSYVCIEVSDAGTGMDEETLKKIFDPFFTTKLNGRGLGLAAALGIIRGHRGVLHVNSRPGEGSTFTVLLPVAPRVAEPLPEARHRPVPTGPATVLVVDDEDTVRSVLRRMLSKWNLSIVECDNGEDAVSLVRERGHEIDCVLMDLSMPKVDGIEAITKMRAIRADLPVVLMSGYDKHEAVGRFENIELAGFLHKPFRGDSLREVMRSMIVLPGDEQLASK